MASPLLESVITFSAEPSLRASQRTAAKRRFYRIIEHFERGSGGRVTSYKRPQLLRFKYVYVLSEESRDNLLRAFFRVWLS
ncbi:hypothetical protein F5Y06DRAFT_254930 [Hypoxylon sp. FL0890]|nr:hypothetical protein F5Y06DRAFT_254930 [Hypoxylon sp. FL0890]